MHEDLPHALELEVAAAREPLPPLPRPVPAGEADAMLLRRGFVTRAQPLSTPFDPAIDGPEAEALAERLGHYAFRLFLRGAIQLPGPFSPEEATRYLDAAQARLQAEALVELGLATRHANRYRLRRPARSFGGTLEWYVARELRLRWGFDVVVNHKFGAPGVGGDLDLVAAAEGKLVYLELKSSPPKHLAGDEIRAFFDRVRALRPDVSLFVVDTALRLGDRVLPMLEAELRRRLPDAPPVDRVERELFALTPHLYAVNAKPDLLRNVGRAIAEGFRALAPGAP